MHRKLAPSLRCTSHAQCIFPPTAYALCSWLYNLFNGVDILNSDFNAGRTWLLQMNAGAAAADVSVQVRNRVCERV